MILDDLIVVYRPLFFRFFKINISLDEIIQTNYRNKGAKTNPRIQIRLKSHYPISWSNYFQRSLLDFEVQDYDKAYEIIKFFKSKGVKTEILTESGRIKP